MPASESELLARIAERSAGLSLRGAELIVGPGDDCAVVRVGGEALLVTVDQLVEGRHYEPGTPIDLVARKAVARSISDIAAMAGEPVWSTATGLLSDSFDEADALFDRMKHWAEHWNAPLIGGDIATGPGPTALTVTVVGRCLGDALLRSGAQPGDEVHISGRVGGSLRSGRHLRFEPRLDAGRAAREANATALIDLSDGLGMDADRLAVASRVRIEIDADRVPMHDDAGGWREAFGAGEDYELLACAPQPIEGFTTIGRVLPADETGAAAVIIADGGSHAARSLGWDHCNRDPGEEASRTKPDAHA